VAFLHAHGINGDDCTSRVDQWHCQRNRGDFMWFLVGGNLPESDAVFARPHRHRVESAEVVLGGIARRGVRRPWDVIHFSFGLHNVKRYAVGEPAVPLWRSSRTWP